MIQHTGQAIVSFLLADPEDEGLWQGIIYSVPSPEEATDCDSFYYWQSLLLEGAIRACPPGTGELRLRSTLRAPGGVTGLEKGGVGLDGDRAVDDGWATAGTAAMLVLTGLCRLAR